MPDTRILFLDIDGVLNSTEYASSARRPRPHAGIIGIDAQAVRHLNAITERTGAAIVVSSTWRLTHTVDELQRVLAAAGATGRVIDRTPSLFEPHGEPHKDGFQPMRRMPRAHEIAAWLDAHPEVTSFVVIDDDFDVLALPQVAERVVWTTWESGLLAEHIEPACAHLMRGED